MEENKLKLIDSLKDCSSDFILNSLRLNNQLTSDEKNLIYLYLKPRPLLDMELPNRIQASRGDKILGFLEPNLKETTLIIEAYRCEQYNRYIKHLMYSFLDPSIIHPVIGNNVCSCGICKKDIYEQTVWENTISDPRKEKLAFRSDNTSISLCLNCLVQLKYSADILNKIEPGFLRFGNIKY